MPEFLSLRVTLSSLFLLRERSLCDSVSTAYRVGGYVPLPCQRSVSINDLQSLCAGSLSPHLFIYSIIYLYQYELVNVYFILGVIIQCYFIYLLLRLFQCWPFGALLVAAPVSLWHTPQYCGYFFLTLSYFLTLQKNSSLIFSFCSSPRIIHFS